MPRGWIVRNPAAQLLCLPLGKGCEKVHTARRAGERDRARRRSTNKTARNLQEARYLSMALPGSTHEEILPRPPATLNEEGGRSHEEAREAPRWGRDTPRNRSLLTLPLGACAHARQGVGLRRNRPRGYLGGVSRKGLMRKPRSTCAAILRLEQGQGVGLAHNPYYRKQSREA